MITKAVALFRKGLKDHAFEYYAIIGSSVKVSAHDGILYTPHLVQGNDIKEMVDHLVTLLPPGHLLFRPMKGYEQRYDGGICFNYMVRDDGWLTIGVLVGSKRLSSEYDALGKQYDVTKQELTALNKEMHDLSSTNGKLSRQRAALLNDVKNLKAANQRLLAENKSLLDDSKNLGVVRADFKVLRAKLHEENKRLETNSKRMLDDYQKEISRLDKRNDEMGRRVATLSRKEREPVSWELPVVILVLILIVVML